MPPDGPPALTRPAVAPSISIRHASFGHSARPLLPSTLHGLLPVAILGAWALSISTVNLAGMTNVGLVSALPAPVIALVFLLVVSFSLALTRRPLGAVVPLIHVLALIVMLYGITSFLESVPRFAAAWKFVGIVDFVSGRRAVTPPVDAFFDWPGFFGLGALLDGAAGYHSALSIAAWGPIVFNLLFLAPLVMIFRWASDDPRVTWLGLWVFYSTNWVAQDYMSNQAVAYTLWLAVLAALLTWFTPRPTDTTIPVTVRLLMRSVDPRMVWSRLRSKADVAAAKHAPYQRVLILLLIVAMFGAAVTGHQLTPLPAVLVSSGLVILAGLQTRLLPVIMCVLWVAWVAYMTTSFLAGHASAVFGPLGQVSHNLNTSVSSRFVGSSGHELVARIRTGATIATWLLAAAGVARRLRSGRTDTAMYVVAGAAFLLPGLQAYGGEVVFRVVLFALPAVSFFIATLVFPSPAAGRNWMVMATVATAACVLVGAFQFTRYGNERFDAFTKGDFATAQAFYRLAARGSIVYVGNGNLPWQYRDYTGYHYRSLTDLSTWKAQRPSTEAVAAQVHRVLASSGGGYVIITRSMKIADEVNEHRPYVLDQVARALRALPGVREVYRNPDGDLFYVPRGA
jgi:hypothetical protein